METRSDTADQEQRPKQQSKGEPLKPAKPGVARRRPQLSQKSRDKLRKTVRLLVDDCITWYCEDEIVFSSSSPEQLKALVCDYLAKRDWYNRGLYDKGDPHEARSKEH